MVYLVQFKTAYIYFLFPCFHLHKGLGNLVKTTFILFLITENFRINNQRDKIIDNTHYTTLMKCRIKYSQLRNIHFYFLSLAIYLINLLIQQLRITKIQLNLLHADYIGMKIIRLLLVPTKILTNLLLLTKIQMNLLQLPLVNKIQKNLLRLLLVSKIQMNLLCSCYPRSRCIWCGSCC